MKHSKIKNSAIVFEILLRKLTSDTINGVENSPSLSVIKEFFNKKTALGKEHELYQILLRNKFSTETKANVLLEQVLNSRKTLNERDLKKEKYEVIKKIKENYDIDAFFNTKLDNYKLYASIYKLFESSSSDSPEEILNEKYVIIENIISSSKSKKSETILEEFDKQSKDIKLITYKILVDKFNRKYKSNLSEDQKNLIREYIYSSSNDTKLLDYIKLKIPSMKENLNNYLNKVEDTVTKIKLQETVQLLNKFNNLKFVKDGDVLSLLRYYELLKELKEINHE